MVRVSPGSPSQWKATRSPRPASTWRSTQLTATLSLPPTNHLAKGRFHSRTSRPGLGPVSRLACASQKPSGSACGLGVDPGLRVGLLGQVLRRREGPRLVQQGRQALLVALAHGGLLVAASGEPILPSRRRRPATAHRRPAKLEPLEGERRGHRGPDEGVTARGAGPTATRQARPRPGASDPAATSVPRTTTSRRPSGHSR